MEYATKLFNNISINPITTTPLSGYKQLHSVNSSLTKILKNTINGATTNISTYTEMYSLPTDEIGLISSINNNNNTNNNSNILQSFRQEQTTTATSTAVTTTFPAKVQTVATYIINSKRPTIIIYPTGN